MLPKLTIREIKKNIKWYEIKISQYSQVFYYLMDKNVVMLLSNLIENSCLVFKDLKQFYSLLDSQHLNKVILLSSTNQVINHLTYYSCLLYNDFAYIRFFFAFSHQAYSCIYSLYIVFFSLFSLPKDFYNSHVTVFAVLSC